MSEKKENVHAGHRQRMRRRFIEHGFEGFQEHEILEMLLFYAIPRRDTNVLAHQLINRYGSFARVCDTPIDVLQKDFSLSESAAVLIKMLPAMLSAYADSLNTGDYVATNGVVKLLRPKFIGATVEKIALVLTDATDRLLFCDVIATGSLTATDSPIRKIVDLAMRHNTRYAYIAHNHPSEFCTPSKADLYTTHVIAKTLAAVGVSLEDHILFTNREHLSLREDAQYSKYFKV